jgi:acyl-CoA thioesterase FadM
MNLIFRLIKTLIRFLLFPKRMDLLGLSRVHFRCWPNDLDTNLHMNNGRYMTLLDLGRLDLLLRTGAAVPAFRRKWYPVLAAVQMRFRKPLNLFQRFTIESRIVTWDAKFVYLEQKMLRKGKIVTHAFLKGAFVGPHGTVPMAELVALLGHAEPPPPLPEEMRVWSEAEAVMAEATRRKADTSG